VHGGLRGIRADYRAALGTTGRALAVPALRRVVLAFGLASAVEAATWVAVGVFAFERSGATAVGIVGLVLLLPSVLFAPAAAALADRHRRKRILLIAYVAEAVTVAGTAVALWADAPAPAVYGLAMLATLALTPIRPAQGAFLPSISRAPADLTAANVSLTTVRNLGLLAGPIVAGLLLGVGGPAAVFGTAAVLAAGACGFLARVPGDPPRTAVATSTTASIVEGARLLIREERGALVVALTFAKHIVLGAIRPFLVIIALGLLGLSQSGVGLLSAALGIGGVLAAGTTVLLIGRRRMTSALILGALLLGVPIVAIGAWPVTAVAVAAMIVCGVGRSLIDVAARTLLSRVSPEDAVARFLGILDGSSYAGLAIGSALAAIVVGAFGIRGALVACGAFLPVVMLVLAAPLARIDRGPLVSRDRLELILGVPMFAPLPPESIETLASQLQSIVVDAGTQVITQGELGDRFYVLASGAARAEIDGRVVSTLGAGDGFGEIALLRDVPRTATVRVTEPSQVMALDRTRFLAVLMEEATSYGEAERLADERLAGDRADGRTAEVGNPDRETV